MQITVDTEKIAADMIKCGITADDFGLTGQDTPTGWSDTLLWALTESNIEDEVEKEIKSTLGVKA